MKVAVGQGSCGIAAGARSVYETLDSLLNHNENLLTVTGCIGMCYLEPIVDVYGDDGLHRFVKVNSEIAEKISLKFPFNHQKGVFNIKCNDEHVKVLNNSDDGKVKIIASSKCMAVSEELCDFFSEFLA